MRNSPLLLCLALSALFSIQSAAQQTASPALAGSTQATALLTQSVVVLAGGITLTDVTLTGSARRIAGSDDDNGTAVFKALAAGASRTDISLSSGQRSEVCDLSATTPAGTWSGPDRIPHAVTFHNLLTEPAWFFPAFAIARRLSPSGYVTTYIGHETHNGQAVEHVAVLQTSPVPVVPGGLSFEHLSQVDFFLDSTTLLPAAIAFNIHPDNNALLDIPVEVRFSDYRPVNAAQVPFHVQKYLNNSLFLNFQAESVAFNTGLSASTFNAQ